MNPLPPRVEQLRLRDLLLLEHIADTGSLRQAAQRMHVTQPAVTQALQGLEQAFGVPLVLRSSSGASLTGPGAAALLHLRVARRELLAAQEVAQSSQAMPFRLGALPMATFALLPRALQTLRATLPGLQVELVESTVARLWTQLARGELDAIICRLPSTGEGDPIADGVVHQTVGHERLVLAAARTHPATRLPAALGAQERLSALRAHAWVLPPADSFTRQMLDRLFLHHGLPAPPAAVVSISFHTNLQLAAHCGLLAVVPESALRSYTGALPLKVIAAPWGEPDGNIVLACRKSSLDYPAIAILRECFAPVAASHNRPLDQPRQDLDP